MLKAFSFFIFCSFLLYPAFGSEGLLEPGEENTPATFSPISQTRKTRSREEMDSPARLSALKDSDVNTLYTKPLPRTENTSPPPRTRPIIFEFSEEYRLHLRSKGLSDELIFRIELLQTAMFRSPHGEILNIRSYFTHAELSYIQQKLGAEHELNKSLAALKELHPQKIPSSKLTSHLMLSPAVRLCSNGGIIKNRGFYQSMIAHEDIELTHISPDLFIEPETPETAEEKAARKKMQEDVFSASEERRGVTSEARRSQSLSLQSIWSPYFDYFETRLDTISETAATTRITSQEINDIFLKLIAPHYESITIDGCLLYFQRDQIDLSREDHRTQQNRHLLTDGSAPIGDDGSPMNLHHLTRRHPGVLVLVTDTFHKKNSSLLHFRSKEHMHQPAPVNRNAFNLWKKNAFQFLLNYLETSDVSEPGAPLANRALF